MSHLSQDDSRSPREASHFSRESPKCLAWNYNLPEAGIHSKDNCFRCRYRQKAQSNVWYMCCVY